MSKVLLVPIRVDGLYLSSPRSVVGPPGFHRLPYVRKKADGNFEDVRPSTPFLAESIHLPPFSDTDTVLAAGVHLHWTLPQSLRAAVHPPGPDGQGVDEARLVFRRAPNRWLVFRYDSAASNAAPSQTWVVHSDHVWPAASEPDPDQGAIWPWGIPTDAGVPAARTPTGEPPWRNVGRAWNLGLEAPIASVDRLTDGLRADGWGDPTFASFYPGCRSIFGLCDPAAARPPDATWYEVFGWYDDPADPDLWGPGNPALRIAGLATPELRRAKFLADFGLDVNEATDGPPTRTVFVGHLKATDLSPEPGGEPEFKVSLAETGAEALAAALARSLAEARHPMHEVGAIDVDARRLEEHLDALLLEASRQGDLVDVGRALRHARHRAGFRALPAWAHRKLRPPSKAAASAGAAEAPPALVQALANANTAVEQAWHALRAREVLQGQLFSDWYRAVKVELPLVGRLHDWPLDQHTAGAISADHLYQHIRQHTIPGLDAAAAVASARVDRAVQAVSGLTSQLEALAPKTPATSGGATVDIAVGAEPPFFAPADPAVALMPARRCTVDRWREAGLARAASGGLVTSGVTMPDGLDGVDLLGAQSDAGSIARRLRKLREVFSAPVAALLTQSETQVLAGHIHPFSVDWSVEFRPSTSLVDDSGVMRPSTDVGAPEVISGRALLTQNASDVLRARVGAYIRRRLTEPVVAIDLDNTVVHPLTAALSPPKNVRWVSWHDREGWSDPDACPGQLPDELDRFAALLTATERMLQAGRAWTEWQDAAHPLGIDPSGPLAQAIVAMLGGHGPQSELERFLTGSLKLPLELAQKVPFAADDLSDVVGGLPFGTCVVLARLLQRADAEGWIGGADAAPADPLEGVLARRPILGLPRGGVVERQVIGVVNRLGGQGLMDEVGLDPALVGPLLDAIPVADLAALATVEHVTAHAAGLLLRYADRSGAFHSRQPPPRASGPISAPRAGTVEFVDPLRTAIEAWNQLQQMPDVMVHTLTGFHDALLQWSSAPQLPIDAPLAFANYRAFATTVVAPRVGDVARRAPLPDARFHPVRAGDLRVRQLRVVDAFGMTRDVVPTEFITPIARRSADQQHLLLPARITQAARIRLDWCFPSGNADPILGWLVADNATGSLVVHDAAGEMLGSLDHAGRWRVAPGEFGPVRPADIDDPHLRALVRRVHATVAGDTNPSAAMAEFLDVIDRAMENIQPPTTPVQEVMALITSRPVAVVRCAVSVELRDPPAQPQDLASLVARIQGAEPNPTFTAEVPLQLGHHHLLADGVVGFYLEHEEGRLGDDLRLPVAGTNGFTVPVGGARPQSALVLMDPKGVVHVAAGLRQPDTSGGDVVSWLLPARELRLSAADYAPALARIDVRLRVGPLLVPAGGVELPMPRVEGGAPSFLYVEDGRWQEMGSTPQVSKAQLLSAFPRDAELWARLVRAGALVPFPGRTEFASVRPPPPPTVPGCAPSLRDLFADEPHADAISRFLQAEARHMRSPGATATDAPRELREGWLRLNSN